MKSKFVFETTQTRSRLMRKMHSKDTQAELIFRKALWKLGFRYRKNYKNLPGSPDIVFLKNRLVIFIDGEFWHGYDWDKTRDTIKSNRDYWVQKIERNMDRDKKVNLQLAESNWTIFRFWSREITKNLNSCVLIIQEALCRTPTEIKPR